MSRELTVVPDVPEHLSPVEVEVWRETVGGVDLGAGPRVLADLEEFAVETARYRAAEAHLREHGDILVLRDNRGNVTGSKPAPEVELARSARARAVELADRLGLVVEPVCKCGSTARSASDPSRCDRGHVLAGNTAAVLTGEHSVQFWSGAEGARRQLRDAVLSDNGYTADEAPTTFVVVAEALAQAKQVGDSAFVRMQESGGPLSAAGRPRRAFQVWLQAVDRQLRCATTAGLGRHARPVRTALDWIEGTE